MTRTRTDYDRPFDESQRQGRLAYGQTASRHDELRTRAGQPRRDEDFERDEDFDDQGHRNYGGLSGSRAPYSQGPPTYGQGHSYGPGQFGQQGQYEPERRFEGEFGERHDIERGRYGSRGTEYTRQFGGGGTDLGEDQWFDTQRGEQTGRGMGNQRGWQQGRGSRFGSSQRGARGVGQFAGRGPKGYRRSDDRIKEEVNDMLTQDGDIDASDIEVSVESGVVTLTGHVHSRDMKRCAEDLAEDVNGVTEVINQIRIQRNDSGSEAMSSPSVRGEGEKLRQKR